MDHAPGREHEGPTIVASTALNTDKQEFTPEDIRFTTNHGVIYAVALGWPASGELHVHTLWNGTPYLDGPVCSVELLGQPGKLVATQRADGLHIQLPGTHPDEPAFTFRILTATHSGTCGSGPVPTSR